MTKHKLLDFDEWLHPYESILNERSKKIDNITKKILADTKLENFALGWHHFGLHKTDKSWIFREWVPNATDIYLVGDFNGWQDDDIYALTQTKDGVWEIELTLDKINHLDKFKLHIYWDGGRKDGYRIPAYANYLSQDSETKSFDAQVWAPKKIYVFKNKSPKKPETPLIYEAHIGMASEKPEVATYKNFTKNILRRIKNLGYNTVQLMAIAEHPYYGSFGYHVANFYAPSSRFGTPDDLKELIDTAHGMGLSVIMDLVHSHSVKNEEEGLANFAGDETQYFYPGEKGKHSQWDSMIFDYAKPQVAHFLLSNVRYWLDEFNFDGYRFDGITSMLYSHHGLGKDFVGYDDYFSDNTEINSLAYLKMANSLVHSIKKNAITIAEDTSGMPGLALSEKDDGIGFDYRMSMGVPDLWIKTLKEKQDEDWDLGHLFYELTASRPEEKVISYVESHDQALVGDQTIMFRLAGKEMYSSMQEKDENLIIDRAIALHKIIRLITASTNGGGYLTFMGNEFGHPEWIDFPRLGNNWSYNHALRRWDLADSPFLKYKWLLEFDKKMIEVISKISTTSKPEYVYIHQNDGILSFVRDRYLFIYNFSPNNSYKDYLIPTPNGKFNLKLSTDDKTFGGFGRVKKGEYFSDNQEIKVYIPARTSLVLEY